MTVFDEGQQQFWREHGYVVVRDVVPAPLLGAVKQNIEEFLGKDLSDPDDWYKEPMYPGGIINMNAHQSMWDTREHPRVHEAFSQIWGTEKLRVSVDRTNVNPPAGPQWDHKGTIHWDMDSTERPVPLKVQGVLCLSDTQADQGGFQCVPGFHRRLEEWALTQPADRPPSRPDTMDMDIVDVPASAGDLIIWHSALPHGNSRNRTDQPRLCQYITMSPAPVEHQVVALHLVRTHRTVVADALGVPEGLVELWLRRQRDADMVRVEADRVAFYDLIPSLIRVEKDGRAQYLNPAWGRILDGKMLEAERAHAERLDLPFTGPAAGSAERIREAMGQVPSPRFEPRLTAEQLQHLPGLFAAGPQARGFVGQLWDEHSTAKLLQREFALELDTKEAELTPLGRRLAGVDAW